MKITRQGVKVTITAECNRMPLSFVQKRRLAEAVDSTSLTRAASMLREIQELRVLPAQLSPAIEQALDKLRRSDQALI